MYSVYFTKQALKDLENLKGAKLSEKAKRLTELVKKDPFQNPPPYEKLVGDLAGLYSRRINIQHRFIYTVDEDMKAVKVVRMWTHYE